MFEDEFGDGYGEALESLLKRYDEMTQTGSGYFEETEYELLLDYYEQRLMVKEALEVVEHALTQHQFSSILLIRKALILMDNRQFEQAHQLLDEAELLDNAELDLYAARANAYVLEHKHAEAIQELDKAQKVVAEEDYPAIYLAKADVYEDWQKDDQAIDALYQAALLDPQHTDVLTRLWMFTELHELYDKSIVMYNAILDKDPYSYQAWYNMGFSLSMLGRYEEAVEAYEYAVAINDHFDIAYAECADNLYILGEYRRAIDCYFEALNIMDGDANFFMKLGRCFEALDDLVKAREYYRQAIQLDPQEALAYYRMGETYTQEEQLQNALASYTKAYKLEQNAEFASAMAYCLAELGETIQATHYYEISIELEKLDLNIWVSYISFLFQEEKYEDALLLIEKARHYLYDVELDYFWAVALFENGNRKEGLNVFAGALEADWTGRTAFFTWLPHLEQDKEILDMVSLYKPSDNEKS